tara:strand:- start:925 stop:1824 length:900 start_codon:yes stop_codon:yes gene_type:complete
MITDDNNYNNYENADRSYIKYNYFAIMGHLVSAITMIALYIPKNSLIIPYTESYLEWDKVNSNTTCPLGSRSFDTSDGDFCIGTITEPVSCDDDNNCYGIDLGWLIISFHLLSFVFQSFAAVTNWTGPIFGYMYSDMIDRSKNPLRFIEYSFSASIMLIAIALLNGVTDINLITSIAVLTSSCQLCGLAVEYVEDVRIKRLLHFNGWLQFCWAYGIIGHAFFKSIEAAQDNSGTGPPNFVYVIVIVLFLLYASFGFVQLYELCAELGPYTKEKAYVLLSLTAKLLLGWMIFSNVLLLSN